MPDRTCKNPECDAPAREKGATGPASPYCSTKCRRRADYLRNRERRLAEKRAQNAARRESKPCASCGLVFVPRKSNRQMYCSIRCLGRETRNSRTETCSLVGCEKPVRAKGLCANHYRKSHPNAKAWSTGRPEARRAALRRKTQRRRARIAGDDGAELIDRDEIGARDGWRCGLCGKRVGRSYAWPHPRSASLDHIVPVSLGGLHRRSNVQIAHLECNLAKSNRVAGDQLALFG